MSECARRLNISRITLYRLCRKYRLKAGPAKLPLALAWFAMPAEVDSGAAVVQAAVFLDGVIHAAGSLLA
jgi:hypothetical protein